MWPASCAFEGKGESAKWSKRGREKMLGGIWNGLSAVCMPTRYDGWQRQGTSSHLEKKSADSNIWYSTKTAKWFCAQFLTYLWPNLFFTNLNIDCAMLPHPLRWLPLPGNSILGEEKNIVMPAVQSGASQISFHFGLHSCSILSKFWRSSY